MKKLTLLLTCILLFLSSCKENTKNNTKLKENNSKKEIATITDAIVEKAVIYEANIRQYSKEGTFDAFTKDIPEIKKLGVKIIWVMPIFPISETKRKATGGDFAYKIKDEKERKKALGSYYAVSDFTKVNPEFGTIENFRKLVKTAHDNGIYVILDWVPNHTGWDHTWIKTNPEFYTKGKDGKITHPLKEDGTSIGWDDVADLNYSEKGLWNAMYKDMSYWIEKENIDGFRCDVAGMVPMDFWAETIPKLRDKKDIFMLAEAWEPEMMQENLFDMAYAWDGHHLINGIAKGEKSVKDWDDYVDTTTKKYEENDILMNFITNHDENSWNGTVKERMGDASEIMLVLTYLKEGMPLIYSGLEYNLNHRLKFFEKDSFEKKKGNNWMILEKLGKLKSTNTALDGGKKAASYTRIISNNKDVLVFEREKNNQKITFVGNLSNKKQIFISVKNVTAKNYFSGEVKSFKKESKITLKAWEYYVLIE